MKSSFLIKFLIGLTCLFLGLFFAGYIFNWDSFKTVQEFAMLLMPFLVGGIVCLWGFGFAADHEDECKDIEAKVVDKSRKIVEKTIGRKYSKVAYYSVLMNMSSREHRDYYNYLRRAC